MSFVKSGIQMKFFQQHFSKSSSSCGAGTRNTALQQSRASGIKAKEDRRQMTERYYKENTGSVSNFTPGENRESEREKERERARAELV